MGEAGARPARQLLHDLAELTGELARAPLVALDQAGDLFAERLPRATKDRTDHAPDSAPG